jgi:hypothetical protein
MKKKKQKKSKKGQAFASVAPNTALPGKGWNKDQKAKKS